MEPRERRRYEPIPFFFVPSPLHHPKFSGRRTESLLRGATMGTRERWKDDVIQIRFVSSASPSTQTFGVKPGSLLRGGDGWE